eukprot:6609837-Karenia_brevis.AAC.1
MLIFNRDPDALLKIVGNRTPEAVSLEGHPWMEFVQDVSQSPSANLQPDLLRTLIRAKIYALLCAINTPAHDLAPMPAIAAELQQFLSSTSRSASIA